MMMFIIGGSSVQPAPILEVTLHAEAEEHLSRAMKCDEELAPSLEIGPRQQDKIVNIKDGIGLLRAPVKGILPGLNSVWIAIHGALYVMERSTAALVLVPGITDYPVQFVVEAQVTKGLWFAQDILIVVGTHELSLVEVGREGCLRGTEHKLWLPRGLKVTKVVAASRTGRIFLGGGDGEVYEFCFFSDDPSSLIGHTGEPEVIKMLHRCFRTVASCLTTGAAAVTGSPIADMAVDEINGYLWTIRNDGELSVLQLDEQWRIEDTVMSRMTTELSQFSVRDAALQQCASDASMVAALAGDVVSMTLLQPHRIGCAKLQVVFQAGATVDLSLQYCDTASIYPLWSRDRLLTPTVTSVRRAGMQLLDGGDPLSLSARREVAVVHALGDGALLALRALDPALPDVLVHQAAAQGPEQWEHLLLSVAEGRIVDVAESTIAAGSADEQLLRMRFAQVDILDNMYEDWDKPFSALAAPRDLSVTVWQHLPCPTASPHRQILVLTDSCLCIIRLQRPADALHALLAASVADEAALANAYKGFETQVGVTEAATTLLGLACGLPADASSGTKAPASMNTEERAQDGVISIAKGLLRSAVAADSLRTAMYALCSRILRPVWRHEVTTFATRHSSTVNGWVVRYLTQLSALVSEMPGSDNQPLQLLLADTAEAMALLEIMVMPFLLCRWNEYWPALKEVTLKQLVVNAAVRQRVCGALATCLDSDLRSAVRSWTKNAAEGVLDLITQRCKRLIRDTPLRELCVCDPDNQPRAGGGVRATYRSPLPDRDDGNPLSHALSPPPPPPQQQLRVPVLGRLEGLPSEELCVLWRTPSEAAAAPVTIVTPVAAASLVSGNAASDAESTL